MRTDVEAVVRRLDPARNLLVPTVDIDAARAIRLELASQSPLAPRWPTGPALAPGTSRFALRVGLAGTVAVVLVMVLIFGLMVALPGGPGNTGRAGAAGQLIRLADTAGGQAPLALGQYRYTDISQPVLQVAGSPFNAYFAGEVQTWAGADGSGRQVITIDPTPMFPTSADQAAWEQAGSPATGPLPSAPIQTSFGPGQAGSAGSLAPAYDVAGLPTDPSALLADLEQGTTGIGSVDTLGPLTGSSLAGGDRCMSATCAAWVRAVALLRGPDVGATPAFRSALYQAMATMPGVQSLGTTTTEGVTGTTFALSQQLAPHTETCLNGTTVTQPAITTTYQVTVDATTTDAAASRLTFTPSNVPSCGPPSGAAGAGAGAGSPTTTSPLFPAWSVLRASGVVDSDTATPSEGAPQ